MRFRAGAAVSTFWAAATLACLAVTPAQASFIVNIVQTGSDVVATGTGALDLTNLTAIAGSTSAAARVQPNTGVVALGYTAVLDGYTGFTGPGSFGSGAVTNATSHTGERVTVQATNNLLYLPAGYVSGAELSSGAVFQNTTLAALGLVDGTYTWSWEHLVVVLDSQVLTGDTYILNIGAAAEPGISVPEPGSLALLALGVTALSVRWRRGRATGGLAA